MKLKVCGLKYSDNIQQVAKLNPDFVGHIFYNKSKRFVEDDSVMNMQLADRTEKVGVFVNASIGEILKKAKDYNLDYIQLHGDESIEYCQELTTHDLKIIKAFGVTTSLPINLEGYFPYVEFLLFDTKTTGYGGSGKSFDWSILEEVRHPFFLSGGIDLDSIEAIREIKNTNLVAIDVNSRFELEPGLKDIKKLLKLTELL